MPRKWRVDGDEDRLPEGMRRVGYDSDTQTYTYKDARGEYTGRPGQKYGELTPTGATQQPRRPRAATQPVLAPRQPRRAPKASSSLSHQHHTTHQDRDSPSLTQNHNTQTNNPTTTSSFPSRGKQTADVVSESPAPYLSSPPTTPSLHNTPALDTTATAPSPSYSSSSSIYHAPQRPRNLTFSAAMAPPPSTMAARGGITTFPRPMSTVEPRVRELEKRRQRRSGPTARGVARELGRSTKGYIRQMVISAMLRLNRNLEKREEKKRAANERMAEEHKATWV